MAEELNVFQQALTNIPRNFGRRLGESIYLYDSPEREAEKARAQYYGQQNQLLQNQITLLQQNNLAMNELLKNLPPADQARILALRNKDGGLSTEGIQLAMDLNQGNQIKNQMLIDNPTYKDLINRTPANELKNLTIPLTPDELVENGYSIESKVNRNLFTGQIIPEQVAELDELEIELQNLRTENKDATLDDAREVIAARKKSLAESTTEREIQKQKDIKIDEAALVGQRKQDELFAGRLDEWYAGGGRVSALDNLRKLREVRKTLKSGNDLISGKIVGNLPDIALPNETLQARDNIYGVIQKSLRIILGAQFAQKEGEMLMSRGFNPLIDEKYNLARVNDLLDQVTNLTGAIESQEKYWKENGQSLQGYQGITQAEIQQNLLNSFGMKQSDLEAMSAEDIMAQRKRAKETMDTLYITALENELSRRFENKDPELMKLINETQ